MPATYRQATREFRAFIADARDRLSLDSDNMTYTAVDGVFLTFRRRLTAQEGLWFADALPAVLAAMFLRNWDLSMAPLEFSSREEMTREAQALRPHHNLTPPNAIEAVAWAVRRAVDQRAFDSVLERMPEGAVAFWAVDVDDPRELRRRIV